MSFFFKVLIRTFIFQPASYFPIKKKKKKNLYGSGEKKKYLTTIKFKWDRQHKDRILGELTINIKQMKLDEIKTIFAKPNLFINYNICNNLFPNKWFIMLGKMENEILFFSHIISSNSCREINYIRTK